MRLSEQWRALEARLPSDWESVSVRIRPERESDLGEVAGFVGAMGAGRVGGEIAVTVLRAGGPAGPQAARRLFGRVDTAGLTCRLGIEGETAAATPTVPPVGELAAAAWDAAISGLPADWSEALARITLRSSDEIDRAALLCAPLNPTRDGDGLAFLFRVARQTGYGAAAATVRRAFERLDAEGIPADVTVLRVLAGTDTVGTQGSSWVLAGKHL